MVELGSYCDYVRLQNLNWDENTLIEPVPAEWIASNSINQ
jgi:hypothetical protein